MKANKHLLYQHVQFLTGIQPARNYLNLQSLESVSNYIQKQLESYGAPVQAQTWLAAGKEYRNIIAPYNAHKSKRLVVGAHYDVAGDQPGADDNASAVAGLLDTARMVFASQPEIDYRIDFVAYCLEEPPFFNSTEMGSYVHARSLHESNADVLGMICFEMIGYFTDEPQNYRGIQLDKAYPEKGNFIIVVGLETYKSFNEKVHHLMSNTADIDVQVISAKPGTEAAGYAGLSDQLSYWKFGIPALMINDTSMLRNPHYHARTDTIDTLDFDKMTEVVNGAYHAIIGF